MVQNATYYMISQSLENHYDLYKPYGNVIG